VALWEKMKFDKIFPVKPQSLQKIFFKSLRLCIFA